MKVNMNIDVHHLARVEGHGNIHIEVKNGKLIDAKWAVVETPRFFEAMVRGLSYEMAHLLTSRVCGICSIGHALASLRAIEKALDIQVPEIAQKLRHLAHHGETLQSHFLHIFFLAAPDFLNVDSVLPLVESHRDLVDIALRLKKFGNDMSETLAGRCTHPVSLCVGGMSKLPNKKKLQQLKDQIPARINDLQQTAAVLKTLKLPDYTRETEFVSLKGDKDYPWIGGQLISTDGVVKDENDFLAMTNEYREEFSTSKWAKLSRQSFAVGSLARLNNNYDFLNPQAKAVAEEFSLKPVNHNPFMNSIAQLVECVHIIHETNKALDVLLESSNDDICADFAVKAGEAAGAVEVPRGILYHHYKINAQGRVEKANCIIPTTQNNANIHYDIIDLVKKSLEQGKTDSEVKHLCEMLVRSYDPCISCSVH